jgi:hypothetical protein
MKGTQSRVGLNELLGFGHLSQSAFPEHSILILSFDASNAAWRFSQTHHQLSILAQGSQHSRSASTQVIFRFDQIQDD